MRVAGPLGWEATLAGQAVVLHGRSECGADLLAGPGFCPPPWLLKGNGLALPPSWGGLEVNGGEGVGSRPIKPGLLTEGVGKGRPKLPALLWLE